MQTFAHVIFGDLRKWVEQPWSEIILVMVSIVCGVIVGIEREQHGKPAGLRTLSLICLGSTIFTLVSMAPVFNSGDPARIAAQIVTGVGFLGAGAIIRERGAVVGLTTAATIWAVAAIGMVVGAGYAGSGLGLSIIIPISLWILGRAELRRALRPALAEGPSGRMRISSSAPAPPQE